MLLTVEELTQWLGMTEFEMLVQTISLLAFSAILTYKLDLAGEYDLPHSDVWMIFSPLFAANVINAYFCVIVFIRTCLKKTYKPAVFRALWSFSIIGVIMLFEYMLCQKLSQTNTFDNSEIKYLIGLLMVLLAVRACKLQ